MMNRDEEAKAGLFRDLFFLAELSHVHLVSFNGAVLLRSHAEVHLTDARSIHGFPDF